jgi:hypothetical protein
VRSFRTAMFRPYRDFHMNEDGVRNILALRPPHSPTVGAAQHAARADREQLAYEGVRSVRHHTLEKDWRFLLKLPAHGASIPKRIVSEGGAARTAGVEGERARLEAVATLPALRQEARRVETGSEAR